MINLKSIIFESMAVDDAEKIFFQHGVRNASQKNKEELKTVYRHLALKLHPDKKGGNAEDMKQLNAAYEALKKALSFSNIPSNSFYGRTMPKDKKTKDYLKPIHFIFKDEYNDNIITQGWFDLIDMHQVIQRLIRRKIDISFDPLYPTHPKTGKLLTRNITVYCNFKKFNFFNKEVEILYVKNLAKRYATTPPQSA